MEMRGRIARNSDVVEILDLDSRHLEAVANGSVGKPGTMLDAIEPFLLHCGNQLAVFDDRRRRVTVVRVYAEDVH